jgi:hypothetical protein
MLSLLPFYDNAKVCTDPLVWLKQKQFQFPNIFAFLLQRQQGNSFFQHNIPSFEQIQEASGKNYNPYQGTSSLVRQNDLALKCS